MFVKENTDIKKMSISDKSFSIFMFSAIDFKNVKFTLGPNDEIYKKLFLSSSLVPDVKAS